MKGNVQFVVELNDLGVDKARNTPFPQFGRDVYYRVSLFILDRKKREKFVIAIGYRPKCKDLYVFVPIEARIKDVVNRQRADHAFEEV